MLSGTQHARVTEPLVLRPAPLGPGQASFPEDPGQRRDRGHRVRAHRVHLVVQLIGPWSSPELSNAARTCTAWALTSSVSFDGLDRGRRDLGSSTEAGTSALARLRSS